MNACPHDSSISAAETYSRENRTSRLDKFFAVDHPCNRQLASCADEVPVRMPSVARQSPSESPGLAPLSYNARWHHRHTVRTAPADNAPPSTDRRHSAGKDWPAGG